MPHKPSKKSLKNLEKSSRRQGTSERTRHKKSVSLSQREIELAQTLGNGNLSQGISRMAQDRLFAQSPVFNRVKLLIELIASDSESDYSESAQSLLYDLEDLEIEQAYSEAIAEGAIELPSGAYII